MDAEREKGNGGQLVWGVHVSKHGPSKEKVLWGVFLMSVGVVLLLAQAGVIVTPSLWKLWPTVLLVMAVGSLLGRKPGEAATFATIGVAAFAAQFRWWGLTWRTAWPLLVIAIGLGVVIGAISGEDARPERKEA